MADRRNRASPSERRLIGERTIRSLRNLTSHARSYPSNRHSSRAHTRRTLNHADLSSAPPYELMEDDDDDEFMDNVATTIEGARVNSDLYDAFGNGSAGSGTAVGLSFTPWPPSSARRITASPSPVSDEWHPPPPLRSPTSASTRPWSVLGSMSPLPTAAGALSRQMSIRRAARSRVDFSEHSQRRRSSMRESLLSPRPDAPESVLEPRERYRAAPSARRFFSSLPHPPSRRLETAAGSGPMWSADHSDTLSPDMEESIPYIPHEHTGTWIGHPWTYDHSSTSPEVEVREEGDTLVLRPPRLRRGGVRPPEDLIHSRHASPVIITTDSSSTSAVAVVPSVLASTPTSPIAARPAEEENASIPVGTPPLPTTEEPVAYPTPGSTENENLA